MDADLRRAFLNITSPPNEDDWVDDSPSEAGRALRAAVEDFRSHLRILLSEGYDGLGGELGDEAGEPVAVALSIVSLECIRRQYDLELALLVAQGLCYGLSWQQMATLLGMKRQSLHKRLSNYVKMIDEAVESRDFDSLRDAASSHRSQPPLQPLADLVVKVTSRRRIPMPRMTAPLASAVDAE